MQEVPRRKALWLEFGAITGFVIFPRLLGWHTYRGDWDGRDYTKAMQTADHALSLVGALLPVLFILWASGDRWRDFGFRRFRVPVDLVTAAVLIALMYAVRLFPFIGSRFAVPAALRDALVPHGALAIGAALTSLAIGAFWEEVVFRGYMITRLEELLGNVWYGVVISAVLFGFGHLYQGWFGALMAFGMGLAFGIAFVARPNIWPLVVAHFASNVAVVFLLGIKTY
jgi:membrane protease YdiL (CAAX protease family)